MDGNGWAHNNQRDGEPAYDFLNDEENQSCNAGGQDREWMETGRLNLNARR